MIDRDISRSNLTRYTKRALQLLPEMINPVILDIGCGTGVPTITLAALTGGKVIGIDNNPEALQKFNEKIKADKLSDRVESKLCDIANIPFEDNSFDVVWAEGSIAFIGFEKGLRDWKRLIKPSGFLVVHDEADEFETKKDLIEKNGYHLVDHFFLQENIWWDEYYSHLNKEIGEHYLDGGLTIEGEALEIFKEIEMYRVSPERFRSVYFIMQKG